MFSDIANCDYYFICVGHILQENKGNLVDQSPIVSDVSDSSQVAIFPSELQVCAA